MTASAKDPQVEIYADGACSGNPGPGGYGAILKWEGKTREISGCDLQTTNNRMEMTAVIKALAALKRPCRVRITTDSNYVVKGMTEWVSAWLRRDWLTADKKPVLNRDLWEELLRVSRRHTVDWRWIKGHAGHRENERCDALAREAIKTCGGHSPSRGRK